MDAVAEISAAAHIREQGSNGTGIFGELRIRNLRRGLLLTS